MSKKKNKKMNQKSFYFEDYSYYSKSQSNNKRRLNISEDRIYLLFFVFFCLISIFTIKIFATSLQDTNFKNTQNYYSSVFKPLRSDITDRNGEILAKNIRVYHAAIKPNLINNKKNLGVGISRNRGLKVSRGRYIIFLDSDDYLLKDSLI